MSKATHDVSTCSLPLDSTAVTYPVSFEGVARFITSGIPDDWLLDPQNPGKVQVYISCWLDKDRGDGQEAIYKGKSMAASFGLKTSVSGLEKDLLKIQASMKITDPESGNERTISFATGAIFLPELFKGAVAKSELHDPFNPMDKVQISVYIKNASDFANFEQKNKGNKAVGSQVGQDKPRIEFKRSSLWSIPMFNFQVKSMAQKIIGNIQANKIGIPPGGDSYIQGLGAWDFAGASFSHTNEVIPPLMTHYALMDTHEHLVNRKLPVALAMFNMQLMVHQCGDTMQNILALPDEQFAPFFCQSMILSRDAAMVPYNRDFKPALGFSILQGVMFTCKNTENMALPCSAPLFMGHDLHEITPVTLAGSERVSELWDFLKTSHTENKEDNPAVLTDDCESSSELGQIIKDSVCSADMSPEGIKAAIVGWPVFKHWTDACIQMASKYYQRGVSMMLNQQIQMYTSIGLATDASASVVANSQAGPVVYNGHAFMVGKLNSASGKPMCFLLEGTSAMRQIKVTKESPSIKVTLISPDSPPQEVAMNMPSFLTTLGKTVANLTQIVNRMRGVPPPAEPRGWPLTTPLAGWISAEMHMCSLDSDPSIPLSFYNRIMYCGMKCTATGLGCMPVQESTTPTHTLTAGCHPYDLNNINIRAVDAAIDADQRDLMAEIIDEANPPIVSADILRQLSKQWVAHSPLCDVNKDTKDQYIRGTKYVTTTIMETPACLKYLPVMLQAKSILMNRLNEINLSKPNSDGIFARVLPLGTGVHVVMHVPDQAIGEVTVVQSLKQALIDVQWPKSA